MGSVEDITGSSPIRRRIFRVALADPLLASTKVFALPELLEQIIVHVGYFRDYPGGEKAADHYNPSGLKQLFVLQRTNTTFQDIIGLSKQLRAAM